MTLRNYFNILGVILVCSNEDPYLLEVDIEIFINEMKSRICFTIIWEGKNGGTAETRMVYCTIRHTATPGHLLPTHSFSKQ